MSKHFFLNISYSEVVVSILILRKHRNSSILMLRNYNCVLFSFKFETNKLLDVIICKLCMCKYFMLQDLNYIFITFFTNMNDIIFSLTC